MVEEAGEPPGVRGAKSWIGVSRREEPRWPDLSPAGPDPREFPERNRPGSRASEPDRCSTLKDAPGVEEDPDQDAISRG